MNPLDNYNIEHKISRELSQDGKDIRIQVFMEEQGFLDEFDDIDNKAFHLVTYVDGKAAACGRLIPGEEHRYTIGRVAIQKEYRGLKLGRELLSALEHKALKEGAKILQLSSQCSAQGFYEKSGYYSIGETYLDEHCPHIHMEKVLLDMEYGKRF